MAERLGRRSLKKKPGQRGEMLRKASANPRLLQGECVREEMNKSKNGMKKYKNNNENKRKNTKKKKKTKTKKRKRKLICSQKHHLFDTFSGTEKMKKNICGKKWLINVYYELRDVRNIVSARTEPNMINTNNITLALSLWHCRCAKLYNNRRTQGSTQGWTQGSVRAHSQLNILVFAGGCIKLLEVLEQR